jgi:hypothetical protein
MGGKSKMNRYKITFATSSGDSDGREIDCDSDAQAAEYAQRALEDEKNGRARSL